MTNDHSLQTIYLGGGCFWCTEAVFKEVRGIVDVDVGYCNGSLAHPTYDDVCTGRTGHNEVVQLKFETATIALRDVLEIFFLIHDPTTLNRQGNDTGTQYRSGIYFTSHEQERVALDLLDEIRGSGVYAQPLVTEVRPLATYWSAEEYHQDFFEKNPNQGYCMAVAAPKVAKFRKTFARFSK